MLTTLNLRTPILKAAAVTSLAALASVAQAEVALEQFWVRAMPPTQKMTAGYGVVRNTGQESITITGGSAAFAGRVEMHTTVRDGDSVRMVPMEPTSLAPGEALTLEPGGPHMMLMGVADMPAADTEVKLCVTTSSGDQCTTAPVLRSAPMSAHDGHHDHSKHH